MATMTKSSTSSEFNCINATFQDSRNRSKIFDSATQPSLIYFEWTVKKEERKKLSEKTIKNIKEILVKFIMKESTKPGFQAYGKNKTFEMMLCNITVAFKFH